MAKPHASGSCDGARVTRSRLRPASVRPWPTTRSRGWITDILEIKNHGFTGPSRNSNQLVIMMYWVRHETNIYIFIILTIVRSCKSVPSQLGISQRTRENHSSFCRPSTFLYNENSKQLRFRMTSLNEDLSKILNCFVKTISTQNNSGAKPHCRICSSMPPRHSTPRGLPSHGQHNRLQLSVTIHTLRWWNWLSINSRTKFCSTIIV